MYILGRSITVRILVLFASTKENDESVFITTVGSLFILGASLTPYSQAGGPFLHATILQHKKWMVRLHEFPQECKKMILSIESMEECLRKYPPPVMYLIVEVFLVGTSPLKDRWSIPAASVSFVLVQKVHYAKKAGSCDT
jgi:hypothetical protein